MTGRTITLHIDRIRLTGTRLSRTDLTAAIHAQLTAAWQSQGANVTPTAGTIANVDGGKIAPPTPSQSVETGVAKAVAHAAIKVLSR